MSQRALSGAFRLRSLILLSWAAVAYGACSPSPEPAPNPVSTAGSQGVGGMQASAGASGTPAVAKLRRGRLGIGCSVKNDCGAGLSCIHGVCQPASFGLAPSGKECVQIDCTSTADCCGDLPSEMPEKCRGRASTCLERLPGCIEKECARSADCAGGGSCVGSCAVSSGECRGNVDCLANKCTEGRCSLDFTPCGSDAECAANTCTGGSCACENPDFVPDHPVCLDEECAQFCLWTCEESRCVIPSTCSTSDDCFGSRPTCIEGACVECAESADCSLGKICVAGSCETKCQNDGQCGLFEACQVGECIYVGCRTHRECTLIPDVRSVALPVGVDPRLLRCHTENRVGRCLIPCQTDSQCEQTEVCSGGLCKYIGCETTEECPAILGVHEQVTTDDHPWVASVECRAEAE